MRLADCLNGADIHTLQAIARRSRLECHKNSKNSLMQAILSYYADPKEMTASFTHMSKVYRSVMNQIIFATREQFGFEEIQSFVKRAVAQAEVPDIESLVLQAERFSLEQVPKKKSSKPLRKKKTKACLPLDSVKLQEAAEQAILEELVETGLVFQTGKTDGRMLYRMPDDVRQRMRKFISSEYRSRVLVYEGTPMAYRDDEFALVRDICTFLQYVDRHEVKLTHDGAIFKRQQLQMMELLECQEELSPRGWRFGYGRRFHDYPDRFALLYDFCHHRNLIVESEEGILRIGVIDDWLQMDKQACLMLLFQYWRSYYRKAIPRLSLALAVIGHTLHAAWVERESLARIVLDYVDSYYYDSAEQVVQQRILSMLCHLGIIARGQTDDGRSLLRLTDLGACILLDEAKTDERFQDSVAETFIVQPNFDVLLPSNTATHIGWELSKLAELKQADGMYIYRFTRDSIVGALQNGWTEQSVLTFLQAHIAGILPGNVETTIVQWCRQHGNVVFDRRVVVTCKSEQSLREIAALPHLKKVIEVIGERHALVDEQTMPEVLKALESLGESPQLNL